MIKEIPIGGEGGWDYITVDSAAHRLYVSHATKLVVVDIDSRAWWSARFRTRPGFMGSPSRPDLGRGFSSNGRANTSTIVDLKTLKPIGSVATGGNPDAILYEPSAQRGLHDERHRQVRHASSTRRPGQVVATIDLGGKPEAVVEDRPANRLFVNIEDTGAIAVIDITTHTLVTSLDARRMRRADRPGIRPGNHRLFSACDNKVMTVTDSLSGKRVTTVPIGDGADGAAFDPATGYAFASNGADGTVDHRAPR